eukprot:gnl/TRDRNA2_/TRDRNA2_203137_c0_seq1.p1 gnl/TRDRNA2_/TRDRNA2_203137_c0~~gnl/TRDRNA2_/TRDRNA2_203137_c0_seq1.p1  ORF type:complete len:114 (+),score=23.77 gnl/TRDRNA2_/TRDRNA2_203137_c0_seq1:94-435(+)
MGACFGVASGSVLKQQLKKDGVVIIDARPKAKYDKQHVAGAVSAPVGGPMNAKQADTAVQDLLKEKDIPKDTPIVVYCDVGGEAASCKKALARAGFTDIVNGGSLGKVETARG